MLLNALSVPLFDTCLGYMLALSLGVAVFACISIHLDAYYGLNDQPRRWVILFGVICLVNLFCALCGLLTHGFYEDGQPVPWMLNLICAGLMLVILCAQLIHGCRQGREETEEDE